MPELTGPELLTPRLRLRLPASGDAGAILRIHQNPAAVAHNPSDALVDRGAAEDLLQRWKIRWRTSGVGYWVVSTRVDPAVVGFCGIKPMRLAGSAVLNLFYRFDPVAWGHGVATEAATAVVDWAARNRPQHQVIARVRPDNVASARVAAKAGLVRATELDITGEDGLDHIWILRPDQRD